MFYLAQDYAQTFAQDAVWHDLIKEGTIIPFVAIIMGSMIAVIAIIFGSVKTIYVSRAREATKREIAAYVAEGSLDPKNAVAMLQAGTQDEDKKNCC